MRKSADHGPRKTKRITRRNFLNTALAGGARTGDIAEPGAKKLSTVEMGDAVLNALEKVAGKQKERA